MDIQNALQIVDNACASAKLSRTEHQAVTRAIQVIASYVMPKPEVADSPEPEPKTKPPKA